MKPFLGIDITKDKKNEHFNGDEFIVASASPELVKALDNESDKALEVFDRVKLPLPARIMQWGCGIAGFSVFMALLKIVIDEDSFSLSNAYQTAPWVFWLAGACLLIWLAITIIGHKKEKAALEDGDSENTTLRIDSLADTIYEELGVPTDAAEVELLSFSYKLKNGEVFIKESADDITSYISVVYKAYVSGGELFLADREHKYAFSLSDIRAIHTVKKRISYFGWYKDVSCDDDAYKSYKLKEDDLGLIHIRWYHILEVEHCGETFGIYFPSYELPIFETLTGLKAE